MRAAEPSSWDPRDRETVETVRQLTTGQTILAFSCGKDSIACWLRLRECFDRIVPVYFHIVPGLEFVEESLAYYERFFGTRIIRLPGAQFYRRIATYDYQPPERIKAIREWDLPQPEPEDLLWGVKEDFGLPTAYAASGVRATDNLNRRATMMTHGTIDQKRSRYFPCGWMTMDQMVATFAEARCKLPIDYVWWGRSFDNIKAKHLLTLKEFAPRDYEKVLEWFPLLEVELFRLKMET